MKYVERSPTSSFLLRQNLQKHILPSACLHDHDLEPLWQLQVIKHTLYLCMASPRSAVAVPAGRRLLRLSGGRLWRSGVGATSRLVGARSAAVGGNFGGRPRSARTAHACGPTGAVGGRSAAVGCSRRQSAAGSAAGVGARSAHRSAQVSRSAARALFPSSRTPPPPAPPAPASLI